MSDLAGGLVASTNPFIINEHRCDVARHPVDTEAPIRAWHETAEFESLAECHARRDKDQRP
jgi:hypothetical protein